MRGKVKVWFQRNQTWIISITLHLIQRRRQAVPNSTIKDHTEREEKRWLSEGVAGTGSSRFAHLSEASQGALRHALSYWHSRFISVHTRLVRICRLVSGWAHSLHLFEDHSTPCLPKHLSQSMLAHCASNGSPPSGGIVTAVSLTSRRSWTTTSVACWSQRNSWRATIIKLDWLWMKMPSWL